MRLFCFPTDAIAKPQHVVADQPDSEQKCIASLTPPLDDALSNDDSSNVQLLWWCDMCQSHRLFVISPIDFPAQPPITVSYKLDAMGLNMLMDMRNSWAYPLLDIEDSRQSVSFWV